MTDFRLRALAQGAAFQLAFAAVALAALEAWARVCEAHRTRRPLCSREHHESGMA